uniref:ABC transmembrane type-1 domain-containing protein n=1 Tax=Panagrellus redivivus TaxID=6233 RepID=A0A7E4ZS16_PANRE
MADFVVVESSVDQSFATVSLETPVSSCFIDLLPCLLIVVSKIMISVTHFIDGQIFEDLTTPQGFARATNHMLAAFLKHQETVFIVIAAMMAAVLLGQIMIVMSVRSLVGQFDRALDSVEPPSYNSLVKNGTRRMQTATAPPAVHVAAF